MKNNKWIKIGMYFIAACFIVFLLIQLIPYGHQNVNPPVISEPNWDSTETRNLAKTACFDCHSNETTHPWYSYVAPSSWLLQYDVDKGRKTMNFSQWDEYSLSADYIARVISSGEMPPSRYLLLHPEAKLSDSDKEKLIQGLKASIQ